MKDKLAIVLSLLLLNISLGWADENQSADTARFDIPPLPLEAALIRFSEQADVQLVMASTEVEGKAVGGLNGEFSNHAALNELLDGTGLEHRFVAAATVAIGPAGSDGRAGVTGNGRTVPVSIAQNQTTDRNPQMATSSVDSESTEEGRPIDVISVFGRSRQDTLREVPQSAKVFGMDFMADVAASDLFNVIRFVPSATSRRSQMGYIPDEYNVRGFDAIQTINGTSINVATQSLDTQNIERVEVLMGPASVLYGSMEPGAVINIVTKKPRDEFHFETGVELGSYDNHRLTLDVGGPISDRVRGRLNIAYQDRESFLDFWSEDKVFVSPVVDFDLTGETLLTVEGLYAHNDQPAGPQIGNPAAGLLTPNPFGEYSRSFFIQDPARDEGVGLAREATRLDVSLTHRFNDWLGARAAVSYSRIVDNDGDMISLGFANNDFRTVTRFFFIGIDNTHDTYSYYLDLDGSFTTGPIVHQVSIGIDHLDRTEDNSGGRGGFIATPVDIFNPVYGSSLPDPLLLNSSNLDTETFGIFVQDRMSIDDRIHLIAGTRYAEIETSNTFTPAGGMPGPADSQRQTDWPTMFGVVYDVTDSVSLFANRSESFVPRSGTTQGGDSFPPEQSRQYETGAKFDIGDTGMSGSVALFQVEKPDVLTPDLDNPGFELPLGNVESRGVELSLQGRIRPGWTVYGAYAYMKTDTESNDEGLEGNDLRLAPANTLSIMTRYDIHSGPFEGVGFTGSLQHVDERFIDDGNTLLLPSYTRVDLGAYYSLNDHVEFSILVNNLTNADIYSGFASSQVELDLPRTFLARMKFRM